jgi:hypothetical protein
MTRASTVVQMLIRVCFVVQLLLGGLFWTNNARGLIPLHQLVGFILVIAIWVQAGLAARAGVNLGLVAFAAVWGADPGAQPDRAAARLGPLGHRGHPPAGRHHRGGLG